MRTAFPAVLVLAALGAGLFKLGLPDGGQSQASQPSRLDQWVGPQARHASDLPALRHDRQRPMYLLLTVEGLAYCEEGEAVHEVVDNDTLEQYCAAHDLDNAGKLDQLLESLEPGGPAGQMQVGYVLTTKLLSLYRPGPQGWQFDASRFARELRLIEKLDRPVALYLSSTHFDSLGGLPEELAQSAENLALFPDLQPRTLSYFSYPIIPYTLNPAPELPVNRYKREALAHIHAMLAELAPANRKKIVAIFLGGETHHFYQGFEDGMGQFDEPVVTDYSPASQQAFRTWLRRQYGSIDALNAAYQSHYLSFDAIEAPSSNFRRDAQTPVLAHYDGYSQGTVPVHGWYWDPKSHTDALRVYVDGRYVADAPQGFNRLDVYRAAAEVDTPSTGFRFDLPFSDLQNGRHMVSVTYVQGQHECLLDERVIQVLGRDGEGFDFSDKHRVFKSLRDSALPCTRQTSAGKRFYLDSPRWDLQVGFNPLARDWNSFRQTQVIDYMQALYDWAVEIGFDPELIFSHQIVPQLNSSWNQHLFASQGSIAADFDWKPGFNLYGGSTWSGWTKDFLAAMQPAESGYGIPEFHPQQWKDRSAVFDAIAAHYNAGAHFISPYYFSIAPTKHLQDPESNAVSRMRLEPGNRADGSNLFFEAIQHFAVQ